jgi:hypothetical protein
MILPGRQRTRAGRSGIRQRSFGAAAGLTGVGLVIQCYVSERLETRDDKMQLGSLRVATQTGCPLGSDRFIGKVETLLGRRLRASPVGRPKEKTAKQKGGRGNGKKQL